MKNFIDWARWAADKALRKRLSTDSDLTSAKTLAWATEVVEGAMSTAGQKVRNLVCPALFDFGERAKVVIFSVTEGEDKPLKYPHMFGVAQVMLLSKVDLIPYLRFNPDLAIRNAHTVNPRLKVFPVSAYAGEGLEAWYNWLRAELAACISANAMDTAS